MKTCSCCGHILSNPYYQVTLTESRFIYANNAQTWKDVQVERAGFLCESCWQNARAGIDLAYQRGRRDALHSWKSALDERDAKRGGGATA